MFVIDHFAFTEAYNKLIEEHLKTGVYDKEEFRKEMDLDDKSL